MIYTADITVPANTAVGSEKKTNIKITNGVLHKLDILFPSGCAGLVKVAIFDGTHPLFPSTAGMTFRGDGETVSFPEFVRIKHAPRILRIEISNIDDTYPHTISVRIGQLPEEAFIPTILQRSIASIFGFLVKSRRKQ